ncbi:MAG: Gmad2 immunoglobulin-like domain-containing protein [Bacteroidia bacterium]
MKKLSLILSLLCIFIFACDTTQKNNAEEETTTATPPDTKKDTAYSNDRFKEVQVEQVSPDTYKVTGTAQVFEATLSYVVEDGHYELAKGFTTTDAGAPEFGNFEFTVNVEKNQPNSTLMLILFESSPKDGSRTHELYIPLD